ncbi:MAG: M43 family zinc metalloprotease [Bacteroidota bacterium]|nr:M43 family zinc metalloprotease [Bacteroidota bacterium]
MRKGFIITFFTLVLCWQLAGQERCLSSSYLQQELQYDPALQGRINAIETFIKQQIADRLASRTETNIIIKIPVVVHILYHTQAEKISDAQVASQINALNTYFRRRNADTTNAPAHFRALGADCEIEFQLAISDPRKRSTTGIVRKYTPIVKWKADDQVKFSSSMGDDAWDPKSYLNIWVCNLDKFAGYATMPGGELNKDGLVISYTAFGTTGTGGYNLGKTAVHEVGHWLNLKHLWGDENCGDDGVSDTPKQASYTVGCPSTTRVTCGNGPYGDMYMNYMDFTNDGCTNLFTEGQKARMRALFSDGGSRNSLLLSKGLSTPLIFESPLPEEDPKWLQPKMYPNPATNFLNLDLNCDERWVGKTIFVTNMQGQTVMNVMITSKNMQIDISRLQSGIYFLAAKKDDGESMKQRFMKL